MKFKYNTMMSAGDYDCGIVSNTGKFNAQTMVVRDEFLSEPMPEVVHGPIADVQTAAPTCTEPTVRCFTGGAVTAFPLMR